MYHLHRVVGLNHFSSEIQLFVTDIHPIYRISDQCPRSEYLSNSKIFLINKKRPNIGSDRIGSNFGLWLIISPFVWPIGKILNCKIKIINCSSSQYDENESLEALQVAIDEGKFCELIFLGMSSKEPSVAFIFLYSFAMVYRRR